MPTRRDVLVLLAAALPGVVVGCGGDDDPSTGSDSGPPTGGIAFDPDAVPESVERFPRTPIAGDMTSTSVVIAFHVADDSPVTLRVWTDDTLVVDEAVPASGDGFHKVFLRDLDPGTTYRYGVFAGAAPDFTDRSLIGQVRTAPADDQAPVVRIALMSCIGQGTILPDYYRPAAWPVPTEEPFQWELFTHASDHDLDALVHLGDQAYLDDVWGLEGGTEAAYLNAWGYYHGGGYRDIYPLAGLYATRDDHESTDNGDFDPWDMTPEDEAKLANAHAAWFKVVPIDAQAVGPIWRSFRWGATLELVVLDCRYELTDERLISEEQLQFLLDRIETSPCRFVCVATPRPFTDIDGWVGIGEDSVERWAGFPADRQRVTELIDRIQARHVLFVCGDIHMNYLGRATLGGTGVADTRREICVTSGNVNPSYTGLKPEQFDYVSVDPALPVLTFDPDAGTVHVAFHLRDGSVGYEQTLTDI